MNSQLNIKSTPELSSDLALIINQLGYSEVSDWLMIASGIKNIDFNWNRFDKTGAKEWCRPSYEYDLAKGDVSQKYINQLTIFNYIWGAYENLLKNKFSNTKIKKYGKVNCGINFIKENGGYPVLNYEEIKDFFFPLFNKVIEQELIKYEKEGVSHEMKIVYELRNKFAHGQMEFPEDVEYSLNFSNPNNLILLIDYSSKIVLLNIQSIISLSHNNENVYSFFDNLFENVDFEDYEDDMFPANFILNRLHLKKIPKVE